MKNTMKYFVFNKDADFTKGYMDHLCYSSAGSLKIEEGSHSVIGTYYSKILDSREKETLWHRMTVSGKSLGDASIKFKIYISENRSVMTLRGEEDIGDILKNQDLSIQEKENIIGPFFVKECLNPTDILLHEKKGRYLWFSIELFKQGNESPEISHIKIYITDDNWIRYLPEIYQSNEDGGSFLERYLYIFQSLYQDMDEKIKNSARYFDPDVSEGEFLKWLAEWIDLDDGYIWEEEKLRYLIKNAGRMYQTRGTQNAISELIELYTGQKPFIIENYQLENFKNDSRMADLTDKLYGDSSYQFTVVISEDSVPTTKHYKTLLKIIDSAKPAHMEANVVVVKPYIFLDKYSYLGMNSVLGQYRPMNLDGFSSLPFASVAESTTKQKERKGD